MVELILFLWRAVTVNVLKRPSALLSQCLLTDSKCFPAQTVHRETNSVTASRRCAMAHRQTREHHNAARSPDGGNSGNNETEGFRVHENCVGNWSWAAVMRKGRRALVFLWHASPLLYGVKQASCLHICALKQDLTMTPLALSLCLKLLSLYTCTTTARYYFIIWLLKRQYFGIMSSRHQDVWEMKLRTIFSSITEWVPNFARNGVIYLLSWCYHCVPDQRKTPDPNPL